MLSPTLAKFLAKLHISNSHTVSLFRNHLQLNLLSQCSRTTRAYSDNVSNSPFHANGTSSADTKCNSPQDSPVISQQLIHHLERTSLVDFDNAEALSRLNEAIIFANQLFEVKTDGVEPLVTVLENESLFLRDDVPGVCIRKDVLSNASLIEEDYFVAPPGNVPLEPSKNNSLFPDLEKKQS